MNEPTQVELIETFDYIDGNLYWKVASGSRAKTGDLAGSLRVDGYRRVQINCELCYIHRLIFKYHHGFLPEYLDHIDGNRLNNDIFNLREATNTQNCMNTKKRKFYHGKPTSSKFKGVYWNREQRRWKSYITIDGKQKYLGSFTNEIDAAEAYNTAATKYFGDYACMNNIPQPL